MAQETKYPNADTSPERLETIRESYETTGLQPGGFIRNFSGSFVRDLLAMLQLRDEVGEEVMRERNAFEQQLHDQRWRRSDEELPKAGRAVQVGNKWAENHDNIVSIIWQVGDQHNWEYWRPIPPLPTE